MGQQLQTLQDGPNHFQDAQEWTRLWLKGLTNQP